MKASIDSSIDRYVDELSASVSLKEVPVKGPNGVSKSSTPRFTLIDGDFPKLQVDLYEQMIYHRDKSTNKNRLELFIPSRYKVNYDKIRQYFAEKAGDKDSVEASKKSIEAWGKKK